MKTLSTVLLMFIFCFGSTAKADIIEFFVTGAQGDGLLPGNISPVTTSTGSGAIGATGILFDTDSNILSVDIEWGSENGYSDLTGGVTLLHLHGPTPSAPPFNFGEANPDVLVNLAGSLNFDSSSTGGGVIDTYFLSNSQEEFLLSGRTYINVHTEMYPTGEIRGYLLPDSFNVPEPSAGIVLSIALASTLRRRRESQQ